MQRGFGAPQLLQGGGGNTFVGYNTGSSVTTGIQNTFISNGNITTGASAGSTVTSGSSNTILGNYNGNQDSLDIRTASNYAVISDGAGNRQITMKEGQTLALDSAVPNAGTGITFPATQSASSDANTLDDYEEGTWTPTVTAFNGSLTTVGTVVGNYRKIGSLVNVFFGVTITTNGTGSNGILVASMPFPFASGVKFASAGQETDNIGFGLTIANSGASSMGVRKYDATYPAADGYVLVGNMPYFV